MNTAESTDVLVDIVLGVDWDKEPECEGALHPFGAEGHEDGPATFLLRTHCRGTIQLCASRARLLRKTGATCSPCQTYVPGDQLIFIEL